MLTNNYRFISCARFSVFGTSYLGSYAVIGPSQLRLYGLHKIQAVPQSLELGKNKKKVISGKELSYLTRNSSLTNSNKCHMCSSSVYAVKLLKPSLSLWRCTSLCTMFMRPLSINYYQFACTTVHCVYLVIPYPIYPKKFFRTTSAIKPFFPTNCTIVVGDNKRTGLSG